MKLLITLFFVLVTSSAFAKGTSMAESSAVPTCDKFNANSAVVGELEVKPFDYSIKSVISGDAVRK